MKERQEERLHPPLKGALGVAVFFGSFSSDVRRNEQTGFKGAALIKRSLDYARDDREGEFMTGTCPLSGRDLSPVRGKKDAVKHPFYLTSHRQNCSIYIPEQSVSS